MCIFHFYCCVFLVFVLPSGVIKNDDYIFVALADCTTVCVLLSGSYIIGAGDFFVSRVDFAFTLDRIVLFFFRSYSLVCEV